MRQHGDFTEHLIETLKKPKKAQAYLEAAIEAYEEDGETLALMIALKNLAQAQGGVAKLSQEAGVNRQHLYKLFSGQVMPKLDTLIFILKGLGYKLGIHPLSMRRRHA